MVEYTLFVEGGGDTRALHKACREGFRKFLEKAGLSGGMPRILACGSRREAYNDFCTAVRGGNEAFLLVDSEDQVGTQHQGRPWRHLAERPGDRWIQPTGSTDEQCHLMVACMENWFLADREALRDFFGQGFNGGALPATSRAIESIPKRQVYDALSIATSRCKTKAPYDKGKHSFKLLASLNPDAIGEASPWAKRLIDELKKYSVAHIDQRAII